MGEESKRRATADARNERHNEKLKPKGNGKPKGRPSPGPASVVERDDVKVGQNRCPYCHTKVRVAEDEWLLCEACLARHHTACWEEGRCCGTCRHRKPVRRKGVKARAPRQELQPVIPPRVLAIGAVALLLVLAVVGWRARKNQSAALFALQQASQAQEAAAEETRARAAVDAAERAAALELERYQARQAALDQVNLETDVRAQWAEGERLERARVEQERAQERERRELIAEINDALHAAQRAARSGDNQRALEHYELALRLSPTNRGALGDRCVILVRLGDYQRAIEACDVALASYPDFTDVLVSRGNARRLRGDAEGALADFDAALAQDPVSLRALNNRSLVRYLEGDLAGALADSERILELDPRHAPGYLRRARAHDRLGNLYEAYESYRRFAFLEPSHPDTADVQARMDELFPQVKDTIQERLAAGAGAQSPAQRGQ
jgi:tetratricopeptide (TPR) repeat protein